MSSNKRYIAHNEDGICKEKSARRENSKMQRNRTLCHPCLNQERECLPSSEPFTFVVGADTQLGILTMSKDWTVETEYSEKAVQLINAMNPKPAFVSICGDLVDMEPMMFEGKYGTSEECIKTQALQYDDFQRTWAALDPDIPLVCLCGNHDVGNTPTVESIERFTSRFGDDYLGFWCRGCYMLCLNSNTFFDSSHTVEHHRQQVEFLESRLQSARAEQARRIFLFTHHPWFLFSEDEDETALEGKNLIPGKLDEYIGDGYFPIGREQRRHVLDMCRSYGVDCCFAGHYHQNLVSETSWGMPMVVTAAVCGWNTESSAKDMTKEENATPGPGLRVVLVDDASAKGFTHRYESV